MSNHQSASQGSVAPEAKQDPYRTFNKLQVRSSSSEIVFRVHDPSSASSLLWTGDLATSGFASPNANLAIHSPQSYTSTFLADPPWDRYPSSRPSTNAPSSTSSLNPRSFGRFEPQPKSYGGDRLGWYLSHSITDHIHGKFRQTCIPFPSDISERPSTPEDDHSPWISTSTSLDWCLWEISRRLAHSDWTSNNDKVVGLAAITYNPSSPSKSQRPQMDLMDLQSEGGEQQEQRWSPPELHIQPIPQLTSALSGQRRDFSGMMRLTYEDAISMARTSSEVLFYGRIFGKSVERNWDFSRKVSSSRSWVAVVRADAQKIAFPLPPEYWAPSPTLSPMPPHHGAKAEKYKASETLGSGIGQLFLHGTHSRNSTVSDPQCPRPAVRSTPREIHPRPSKAGEDSWLDQLVWDPRVDDFRSAMVKVHRRRVELSSASPMPRNSTSTGDTKRR